MISQTIEGFGGNYTIYEDGRIYSKCRNVYLSPRLTKKGYHSVILYFEGVPKNKLVHRLVMDTFDPISGAVTHLQINHIDGNKTNNHRMNLERCTAKENVAHAYLNGLIKYYGENTVISVLTENNVLEIRNSTLTIAELARKFKVHPQTVQSAITGITWKHLPMGNYVVKKLRPPLSQGQKDLIIEKLNLGYSQRKIASELNLNKDAVRIFVKNISCN